MTWSDLTPLLVALLGTGGVLGAVVAFFKIRPEAGEIAVSASQGALIVQTGVIETLRRENQRALDRIAQLEEQMLSVVVLKAKIERLEDERTMLIAENRDLRDRVQHLEAEVLELRDKS